MSTYGITISGGSYRKTPYTYSGTAVVRNASGNIVTDSVSLDYIYSGTLRGGQAYEETDIAPSEAGVYFLTIKVSDSTEGYEGLCKYSFSIVPQIIRIKANDIQVEKGASLPQFSCRVDGLMEGDVFITEPSFQCRADNTQTEGLFEIIPTGANAGNNYSIRYENGTLQIGSPGIVAQGNISNWDGGIHWEIDGFGKLTVIGHGNYVSNYYSNAPWYEYADKIKSAQINLDKLTTTRYMFAGCKNLTSVDLSGLDTSRVLDMTSMFTGCYRLPYIDLSTMDTHSVTDMTTMFNRCRKLNNLAVDYLDTGNVTTMRNMFSECSSLTSLDLRNFSTENVTDMASLFYGCTSLQSLNLSNFDTSKVTTMSYMFSGCENMSVIDVSGFDTSCVTDMRSMFARCSKVKSLDLSHFVSTGNCNYGGMFEACSALKQVNVTSLDVRNSDLQFMFYECYALETLDLSSFDMSNSTSMTGMIPGSLKILRCPTHCAVTEQYGNDREWYRGADDIVHGIPNVSESITLYRDGYPGDGETMGLVTISGISAPSVSYNGNAYRYHGTPIFMEDGVGDVTDQMEIQYLYSGTLTSGERYALSEEAPVHAGTYTLTLNVSSQDGDFSNRYYYDFSIYQIYASVIINDVELMSGNEIPATWEYRIEGLLSGDTLLRAPIITCEVENSLHVGNFRIIGSGADAGADYIFSYQYGNLRIRSEGGDDPGDDPGDNPGDKPEDNPEHKSGIWIRGLSKAGYTYAGGAITPAIEVCNGDKLLRKDIDYSISYRNNRNVGTAIVQVKGKGNYTGKDKGKFEIKRASISAAEVRENSITVNTAKLPSEFTPQLIYNGVVLKEKRIMYILKRMEY